MSDRIDWAKVLANCDSATERSPQATQDGQEPMKSNQWKERSEKTERPKKKRRDQSRGDARDLQPSGVTASRWEETCITMAYFGLQTEYSFQCWLSSHTPDDVLGNLGVNYWEVAGAIDAYARSCHLFIKQLDEAAQYCEPNWLGYNLKVAVDNIRQSHSIKVTDKFAKQGMQCSIDKKACKSNHDLLLIEMVKKKVQPKIKFSNGAVLSLRADTGYRKSIIVGTRWIDLLLGIFWFSNLDYLVAKQCRQWVAAVRSLAPEVRHELYANFAAASDAELSRMFIQSHKKEVEEMRIKAQKYVAVIDKQRSVIEKKVVEWRKKHNAKQQKKEVSANVTVVGNGNAVATGGGNALVW